MASDRGARDRGLIGTFCGRSVREAERERERRGNGGNGGVGRNMVRVSR